MRGRAGVVGDVGPHAPDRWEGGLGGPDIHAMAWIRTDSDQGREEAMRIVSAEMEATGGVEIQFVQDTLALAHANGIGSEGEHFGFADPISQPPIDGADTPWYPGDGVPEPDGTWRPLKPGEFLLGYEDEAGPDGTQTPEPLELRLNGTYMVFRKLYQDVSAFRRYLGTAAKALYGSDDPPQQDLVAAKLMGRWRSGCPVDLSPENDDLAIAADPERRNNFTYAGDDEGLRCPIGAHLRRSNPRTAPLKRATAVQRHRLIRRGVEYGPHLTDGVLEDDGIDRGLVNLFIQADIDAIRVRPERVDEGWRVHRAGSQRAGSDQRRRRRGLADVGARREAPDAVRPPTFVLVKGGEYLFVPGLKAFAGADRAEVLSREEAADHVRPFLRTARDRRTGWRYQ